MRYDQTEPKYPQTATQAVQPSEPTLLYMAEEALKWQYEVFQNLGALERGLFGGPTKPTPDLKALEQPNSLDAKLSLIASQMASLTGFTAALLSKVS